MNSVNKFLFAVMLSASLSMVGGKWGMCHPFDLNEKMEEIVRNEFPSKTFLRDCEIDEFYYSETGVLFAGDDNELKLIDNDAADILINSIEKEVEAKNLYLISQGVDAATKAVHAQAAGNYGLLSLVSGMLAVGAMACAAKAGRDNNGYGVQGFAQAQFAALTTSVVTGCAAVSHAYQAYPEYTVSSISHSVSHALRSWNKSDGSESPVKVRVTDSPIVDEDEKQ